jgi:hypothetical protein
VKDWRGQSSRTRDKEDLQPKDRGTPSHKYAPAVAPININLAATIKFEKREFHRCLEPLIDAEGRSCIGCDHFR